MRKERPLIRQASLQWAYRATPGFDECISGRFKEGESNAGDGVVPVIDLRKQIGTRHLLPSHEASDQPPCILTLLEGAMAGILVDQVLSIRDIPADRFEPVKDGTKLPVSHVVSLDGRMVSVLTIDRLLPAA